MFRRRSADRLSSGQHKAARRRRNAVRSEVRICSSVGFISHLQASLDPTPDAQLIHLKRPPAGAQFLPAGDHFPPPSEWTYTAMALIVAGSRRSTHAGITPERPLVMVSMMVGSSDP